MQGVSLYKNAIFISTQPKRAVCFDSIIIYKVIVSPRGEVNPIIVRSPISIKGVTAYIIIPTFCLKINTIITASRASRSNLIIVNHRIVDMGNKINTVTAGSPISDDNIISDIILSQGTS